MEAECHTLPLELPVMARHSGQRTGIMSHRETEAELFKEEIFGFRLFVFFSYVFSNSLVT